MVVAVPDSGALQKQFKPLIKLKMCKTNLLWCGDYKNNHGLKVYIFFFILMIMNEV